MYSELKGNLKKYRLNACILTIYGNSLPGAFNLMAQAAYNAGVITENSTAALEKAMKSGKVMAEDVLPAFADILNEVTATANFDSLQTSINRLKNSWTEMVEVGNFEGFYKRIIDGAQKVVKYFAADFTPRILGAIMGVFGGTVGLGWAKSVIKQANEMKTAAIADFNSIFKSISILEDEIGKLGTINMKGRIGNKNGRHKLFEVDNEAIAKSNLSYKEQAKLWKQSRDAIISYNKKLIELNDAQKLAGTGGFLKKEDIANLQKMNEELDPTITAFDVIHGKTTAWRAALRVLGNVGKMAINMIGSALASIAIGAIIGGITTLIAKFIEARKEAKRIQNIATDMEKAVRGVANAESDRMVALTNIRRALESIDEHTSTEVKVKAINDVNEALGLTGKNLLTIEDDIKTKVIPAVDTFIGKLRAAAMQQAIIAQISSATSRIIQLETENMELQRNPKWGEKKQYGEYSYATGFEIIDTDLTREAKKLQKSFDKNTEEINKLNEGIKLLEGPGVDPNFTGPIPPWQASQETLNKIMGVDKSDKGTNNKGGSGGTDDTPSSVMTKYKKDLKELENQFQAGAITAAGYKEKLEKLNSKAFEDLAAFGWENVQEELSKSDFGVAEKLKNSVIDALIKAYDDPSVAEAYDKMMAEEGRKAFDAWYKARMDFEKLLKQRPIYTEADYSEAPTKSSKRKRGFSQSERETYLDTQFLKSTESNLKKMEDWKQSLEDTLKFETDPENLERIKTLIDGISESIERLKNTAGELQDKVNLAKIENEIKKLKDEGIESLFSSFTTLSDGLDRLYNAYKGVMQINDSTWKNEDIEEFITKMNAVIQTMEVLKSIYAALKTVVEVYGKLKEKNSAKEILLNKGVELSEKSKAGASAKSTVAQGADSVAGIPFVGAALAVAAIAAITAALMAGMGKFAKGGIVGGNSYSGDKQVARLNSSEMVLTRGQQAQLWGFISGGSKRTNGGEITFRLRGSDIVGSINNYNRLTGGR